MTLTTRAAASALLSLAVLLTGHANAAAVESNALQGHHPGSVRERVSLNSDWRFWRSEDNPDGIVYDKRPAPEGEALEDVEVLKPWILPCGNDFIKDPADRHERPAEEPSTVVPYVSEDFDDGEWEEITLPHDWAINGPYDKSITASMAHLPIHGVGWYRRTFEIKPEDRHKQIYLDLDGAQSYAMVWVNGKLVGGWPYGYNSFRLDVTDHVKPGKDNQLAIRIDNPPDSARWYPGAGIYRSVWLTKLGKTHVGQWGTFVTAKDISSRSATLDLVVEVENDLRKEEEVRVVTTVHPVEPTTGKPGKEVAKFKDQKIKVGSGEKKSVKASAKVRRPRLWGPPPTQKPNLYVAVTRLYSKRGEELDRYETEFGIRTVEFTPDNGMLINGERIEIQGANQHHDLGALGAAFNVRAAERQLEILGSMGVNSIRMAHNPPDPELLRLTDHMGFVVMDEVFDVWEQGKMDYDFHLIFNEWSEADLRSMLRRDRNHASVVLWSFGNEVVEQHDGAPGAVIGHRLRGIVREEDTTRLTTASMNWAAPDNEGAPFIDVTDVMSLNYQGAGIRYSVNYAHLEGTTTEPMYPAFHEAHPGKALLSSESAAALSSRGVYMLPVVGNTGAPVNDSSGGNSATEEISAYELYSTDFGSPADVVFESQDRNPYTAGEFIWSGFDYLGEPTPYNSRSAYFGPIDMAGLKKDRYYLYQSRWRPDLPMAHILPHWNWPGREGKETPVHVFTSGDSAELFLNGESLGKKSKGEYEYRLRWDDVEYTPGELHVVAYRGGEKWAEDKVRTTGKAVSLRLTADRTEIGADGVDLSFVTAEVVDEAGDVVPGADNSIRFSIKGGGESAAEIVATDNGHQADYVVFKSLERNAYSGMAIAIVKSKVGGEGEVEIVAEADGLTTGRVTVEVA